MDTAILLCGVLTCRQHFAHKEISDLAHDIYSRVDWSWLSEDTPILPHGWRPETGFLNYRWDDYSELMMMYLLGLGSDSHPVPPDAWDAWKRTMFEYDGIRYIGSFAPLFVHQYSQAWFDFRNKRDQFADYFQNSTIATDVHRRFCMRPESSNFPTTATICGASPPLTPPTAMSPGAVRRRRARLTARSFPAPPAGSIPFLPEDTMRVLRTIKIAMAPARGAAMDSWTRSIR